MSGTPRRKRLVEKGGLELFEVRVVHWIDKNGDTYNTVDTTVPEGGMMPSSTQILGVLVQGLAAKAMERYDQ